jgi:hypothetical protein
MGACGQQARKGGECSRVPERTNANSTMKARCESTRGSMIRKPAVCAEKRTMMPAAPTHHTSWHTSCAQGGKPRLAQRRGRFPSSRAPPWRCCASLRPGMRTSQFSTVQEALHRPFASASIWDCMRRLDGPQINVCSGVNGCAVPHTSTPARTTPATCSRLRVHQAA